MSTNTQQRCCAKTWSIWGWRLERPSPFLLAACIIGALGLIGILIAYTRTPVSDPMMLISLALILLSFTLLYWTGAGWQKVAWSGLLVLALFLFGASLFVTTGQRFWLVLLALLAVSVGASYAALDVIGPISEEKVLQVRKDGYREGQEQ